MSKLALITGGAKRIGKGIALSLAENGYDVVVHYSESKKEAEELVTKLKSFGVAAFCFRANLLKDYEMLRLFQHYFLVLEQPISKICKLLKIFQ